MNRNYKDKKIYIDKKSELLIWLIILLIIVFISFCRIHYNKSVSNSYNIFMPDIDGLIVGSPVRTMGVEVGHITKIKPTNDEVYVKFVLHNKSLELPQGTKATVEFSGMAGSKSLELYLPDDTTYIDSTVPMLSVEAPKRLHDAFGLLNDMFKKIGDMIYISSNFGKKMGNIDFPAKIDNSQDAQDFIKYTNEIIDVQQKRMDDLGSKLKNEKRK